MSASVPVCTTRPCSRITSRSASVAASTGSWVTRMRMPSNACIRARRSRRTATRACWSSAASGSSSTSRRGATASARASATRCACPPESAAGPARRRGRRGRRSPASRTRRRRGRGPARAVRAEPERDVVERAEVREQHVVLEHHADGPPLRRDERGAAVVEHHAVELDPAGVDRYEAAQRAQHRRLAGAVRAEQRDGLTGRRRAARRRGRARPSWTPIRASSVIRPRASGRAAARARRRTPPPARRSARSPPAGATRAGGTPRAASSASGPGCCRRR